MFKKFLFALLLLSLPYALCACALCALYTPSATVNVTMDRFQTKSPKILIYSESISLTIMLMLGFILLIA